MLNGIHDIVPLSASSEEDQNSEPSVAVNPLNPYQMVAGAFLIGDDSTLPDPYYVSLNGGLTWTDYGAIAHNDKTIAWKADGTAVLTAILGVTTPKPITTYSGVVGSSNFSQISNYSGVELDQPWIETGPSNHVYVAYNGNDTASVLVSTDGGVSFDNVVLDESVFVDAPAVRVAVSGGDGNTVYAAFTRRLSTIDQIPPGMGQIPPGLVRYNSEVVVVRSDDGGADQFDQLGDGVVAATTISPDTNNINSVLSLGQNRSSGGDLSVAVDPNDAEHVVLAYTNAPGANIQSALYLGFITESFDGGETWTPKFATSATLKADQLAIDITDNGTIGFLYDSYDVNTNTLSQHFLTTANDFATITDTVLATETNSNPDVMKQPYLGDFFNLTHVGNHFYGTFSASNDDDGTDVQFPNGNVSFSRRFVGTPGTASFQLVDANGNSVDPSIDPYFFDFDTGGNWVFSSPTSELAAFGSEAGGWSSNNTYPREVADVNGDGKADIVGFASTGVYVSLATSDGKFADPVLGLADAFGSEAGGWSSNNTYPREVADVNGDGKADIVGFASTGVYVSLATSDGKFADPVLGLADAFGSEAGGWSSNNTYPREVADVNGDGKADIVGFASTGVYVSLATSDGKFADPVLGLADAFGSEAGGWSSNNTYPREVADVNGDGKADIVGFASTGVYVSLATSDGKFADPVLGLADAFGSEAGGWSSNNTYPREVADVNGDGKADIVGFASTGVYVSLATSDGKFADPVLGLADAFGSEAGGWSSNNTYPREVADVTGDRRADIVGFGAAGVDVSIVGDATGSSGGMLGSTAQLQAMASFGASGAGDTLPLEPSFLVAPQRA